MSSLPTTLSSPLRGPCALACLLLLGALAAGRVHANDKPVYKCPGNLYTDALSSKEAQSRGCRTLDGAPITVIQSVPRTAPARPATATPGGGDRISVDKQKSMDTDARRILEAELRKEEEALTGLRQEYNNGQPERRGDEKNYQKYLDRVEQLKAEIARRESNVASLKRELAKFSPAAQ